MKKKMLRRGFVIGSCAVAGIVLFACMMLFDSDFQNLLIAPMIASAVWLGLAGYANS